MAHKSNININEIPQMTSRLKHSWTVKQAWEYSDIYKVYDCVVKILPDLTFQEFDYFQQHRIVFHESFVIACNEIAHCMAGVA